MYEHEIEYIVDTIVDISFYVLLAIKFASFTVIVVFSLMVLFGYMDITVITEIVNQDIHKPAFGIILYTP